MNDIATSASGGATASTESLLEITGLTVAHGGLTAVHGVTVRLAPGRITALVGPNGAGKTTLVNTAMGLHTPAAGSVRFKGHDITRLPVHERIAMGMALVPEARRLFPLLTVEENLELGAYTRRTRPRRQALKRQVFERFPRLAERRHQRAGSLSGGEQQMLALGRALMADPELLILDEPSLGLAPVIVQDLFAIVRELNQAGVSVLIVEQNTVQTLQMAHDGFVLESGRIVLQGSGQDLLADDHVRRAYLGDLG